MFKNYVLTALRNLKKNKLFALINIGGLAIGLAVFVFANLLANYEEDHDRFFENSGSNFFGYGDFNHINHS